MATTRRLWIAGLRSGDEFVVRSHSFGVAGTRPHAYFGRELGRRLRQYADVRLRGYPDRGTAAEAASTILSERAERGFVSGGHFRGVWPRDLCFAAPGLVAAGYEEELRRTATWIADRLRHADLFFTDVHDRSAAAVPTEGVDTFPALVILLDECNALDEARETIPVLSRRHRERFFDDRRSIVTGSGSSWWDSAAHPRETYNTAILLAAISRLESEGVDSAYDGCAEAVRSGMLRWLWTGEHFAEHRDSAMLACDANVVPLYFGILDSVRARDVFESLDRLQTGRGLCMRERPFALDEVRPIFLLHRDYHYHVWPWNSLMYAIGARRYGYLERAGREREHIATTVSDHGTFLEVLTGSGNPYVKRGYASAGDFTVAAALWVEACERAARDEGGSESNA